jgi:hypothetical protein
MTLRLCAALLCLCLTSGAAFASPRSEPSRDPTPLARSASPEEAGPERMTEASSLDAPGLLGLLTALSASFVYARRTRRPR